MYKVLLACFLFSYSLSANADFFIGATNINGDSKRDISVIGPANIEHTNIEGKLNVTGPLKLNDSKVKYINVIGTLNAAHLSSDSLNIVGNAVVNKGSHIEKLSAVGFVTVTESQMQDIEITSAKFVLTDSTANSIIFKKEVSKQNSDPSLYLIGNAKIHGTVTFESGTGKVYVDQVSAEYIKPEQIIGGQIIYQDPTKASQ